jgi:hypothetical protein
MLPKNKITISVVIDKEIKKQLEQSEDKNPFVLLVNLLAIRDSMKLSRKLRG